MLRHLLRRDLLSYTLVGLAVCLTVVASLQLAPLFGVPGLPGTVLGGAGKVALPPSAEKRQVASSRSGAAPSAAARAQARTSSSPSG